MSKNVHSEVSKDSPLANSIFGEIHGEEKATKCDMTSSGKCKEKLIRFFSFRSWPLCLGSSYHLSPSLHFRSFLRVRQCYVYDRVTTMLNTKKLRSSGGSKGTRRGREKDENYIFFRPCQSPVTLLRPNAYPKGCYFYSRQSSSVEKSKMTTTASRT